MCVWVNYSVCLLQLITVWSGGPWSSFYQVQQKECITFDLDLNAKQKIEKAARVLPQNLSTSFRGRMCQWPGREDRITSKVMCCNFTGRTEGLPRMDWFNVLRRLISLRRHSVLPPWSICASVYPKTNFWESQSEKWTLWRTSCVSPFSQFFTFVASLECNCFTGVRDLNPFM